MVVKKLRCIVRGRKDLPPTNSWLLRQAISFSLFVISPFSCTRPFHFVPQCSGWSSVQPRFIARKSLRKLNFYRRKMKSFRRPCICISYICRHGHHHWTQFCCMHTKMAHERERHDAKKAQLFAATSKSSVLVRFLVKQLTLPRKNIKGVSSVLYYLPVINHAMKPGFADYCWQWTYQHSGKLTIALWKG